MKAGSDAEAVEVVADWREEKLAFDHMKIIEDAWVRQQEKEMAG